MLKTKAQLSPIFGFFPDPDGLALKTLYDLTKSEPDICINETLQGYNQQVSFVESKENIAKLTKILDDKTVYIADGHHRYETALQYRDYIKENLKANARDIPKNSALDYVMIYLLPMSDPGLCILPTHRLLFCENRTNAELLSLIEPFAEIKEYSFSLGGEPRAREDLVNKLAEDDKKGLTVFGLFLSGAECYYFLKIKEKVKDDEIKLEPQQACLRALDVSILTDVLLIKGWGLTQEDLGRPECINYVSSVNEAIASVKTNESRAAFILNATSVDEILKVTEEGLVMPRKATYFYPKVSTGLVINLIDPQEPVDI
jgi:uncharacterized protein (DUF1015 family)